MVYNKQIKRGQKNNYRTKNKPVCIYIIYHSNKVYKQCVMIELSVHLDTGGQSYLLLNFHFNASTLYR